MKTYWITRWIKQFSTLLLSVFLLFGCITAKKDLPSGAAVVKANEKLKNYLDGFEEAVKANDKNLVMEMLDPAYVDEQHDNFLEGRTDQFLSEFFDVEFDQIKKLKFLTYYKWRDILWVKYIVYAKDGKHTATWSIQKQDEGAQYKFGLVGAVG